MSIYLSEMQSTASPFVMVIFGATGDLTARKLMPALFKMYSEGFLSEKFFIVAVARRSFQDSQFREHLKAQVNKNSKTKKMDGELWEKFAEKIYYQQGFFEEEKLYQKLLGRLIELEKDAGEPLIRYFYLATPPQNYASILTNLESGRLSEGYGQESNKWTRILIEKPFGKDAESARQLEEHLAKTFEENQIYRIDHYLGKEAIQNIIAFRFANGIFEPIWNKDYIDHMQITMAETAGLEGRIGFYEGIGALRDVMQNHMLEMLALVAMEQPRSFSADEVRNARGDAIKSIRLIAQDEVKKYVVRGQYGQRSEIGDQRSERKDWIVGYRQEKGVNPGSMTDTYVAMKVFVDTPRWLGIPWYLRTGKRLKKNAVEISMVFKQTCHILFKEIGCPEVGNILTLRVSPSEGIGVRFIVKEPGHEFRLKDVDMDFNFRQVFSDDQVLEAYERILEDIFRSDQMLFNRSDEMAGSWRIINPIIKAWENDKSVKFPNYPAGSWGPKEGEELIGKDGRKWVLR